MELHCPDLFRQQAYVAGHWCEADKGARAPPLNIVSIGDQLFERVASHAAARVSTLSPHIVADDVCGGMSASYLHGHGMPHP